MIYKTSGVVFRFTRYGETSIIVTIFTALFGLQSYIVNGARSKSSKGKMALFQPLTLLDLVVYHRANASIMRIKELKCLYPYQQVTSNVRKSSIALFLNEVLNKSVKEESHAEELCNFLIESLITLDQLPEPIENFHLTFLVQLSRYLGFSPQSIEEVARGRWMSDEEEKALRHLVTMQASPLHISYVTRKILLDVLTRFYATHVENFGELRSTQVLHEILT